MQKIRKRHKFKVGAHTSIAGGIAKSVERAMALNCNTLQIFSHNPRQWGVSPIPGEEAELFAALRKKYDIRPAYIHASYLINLASLSKITLDRSIKLLSQEMENADALGAEYVVLHTGSASGDDERKARARAAKSILKAIVPGCFKASLILENTAGQRGDITSSIKTLAEMIDICGCKCIAGICIDTCHAFTSGYDLTSYEGIENLISEIRDHIGLDKLKLIHLNDSKKDLGSGIDRHEHIGQGFIGIRGFKKLLSDKRVSRVPLILETPKERDDDDKRNLKKVFNILSNIHP